MFRIPLLIALALIIAFGGGVAATFRILEATSDAGATRIGPWEAFPDQATGNADPYARAQRAISGQLLYGTAEGLVFTARTDDSGQALDGRCHYRLYGQIPYTRLWTLHATDTGGRTLRSSTGLPDALASTAVLRMPPYGTIIEIAARPWPYNWLSVPENTTFSLVLTLLDTPAGASASLADTEMPRIEKMECGNV